MRKFGYLVSANLNVTVAVCSSGGLETHRHIWGLVLDHLAALKWGIFRANEPSDEDLFFESCSLSSTPSFQLPSWSNKMPHLPKVLTFLTSLLEKCCSSLT